MGGIGDACCEIRSLRVRKSRHDVRSLNRQNPQELATVDSSLRARIPGLEKCHLPSLGGRALRIDMTPLTPESTRCPDVETILSSPGLAQDSVVRRGQQ